MSNDHSGSGDPPTIVEKPSEVIVDSAEKGFRADSGSFKEDVSPASPVPKQSPNRVPRWIPFQYNRHKATIPLNGKNLVRAAEWFAGLAILGVMSGVNTSPDYLRVMGIDSGSDRDSAALGGIVAVYYGGTLCGAVVAGVLGDRIGRLPTLGFACMAAIVGAALQTSAQNLAWMCIARVITGVGTGGLNTSVPVWEAEVSSQGTHGSAIGFSFFLNIVGLSVAYWLEYGLRNSQHSFRWRFPLSFQIIFLCILLFSINFFVESPRWLARNGREDDARYVLARLRTANADENDEQVLRELADIKEVVEVELREQNANRYMAMAFKKDRYNVRRRVWLAVNLQIVQELVGIGVITVYAPTVFGQAGFSENKSALLSGINDLTYAAAVWVAVLTLDRVGRRPTLYIGAIIMGISLILCGIAARYVSDTSLSESVRFSWGCVVCFGTFTYTATFGATWLTIPWLLPVEISPLHVRARGSAFSVVGWSIGNGVVTMITPYLFKAITYWTFILFALFNFVSLPIVWALYPETARRSLEEIDVLFTSSSIWVWKAEAEAKALAEADPDAFEAARHGDIDAVALRQRVRRQGSQTTIKSTRGPAADEQA